MNIKMNVLFFSALGLISCSGEKAFDGLAGSTSYSGNLVVTTVATDPSTGPGVVGLFDVNGAYISTLKDYYTNGADFPSGSAFLPPNEVLVTVDGVDRVDKINLDSGLITPHVVHSGLTATPLRQMARSEADGSIYVIEYNINTVEKFDSAGSRAGGPFIPATVGSCALSNPFAIAYIPTTEQIAVVSYGASGRLSIYDKNGNCVRHFTTSPMNAGTPSGVTYHALSNKLIIARATDHSLWSVNLDGTSPAQIYLNSTIISTPRALTSDSAGNIYVGSTGTDTVEKLYYSGTGLATRVLSGPLVGPGVYSQNVTSITVIP